MRKLSCLIMMLLLGSMLLAGCGGTANNTSSQPSKTDKASTSTGEQKPKAEAEKPKTEAEKPKAEAKKPLKIGVVLDITGPYAGPAGSARNGIQMAVDAINSKGGVYGHLLEVSILDSQGKETEAALMVKRHLDSGVSVIVGTTTITTSAAMKKTVQDAQVPMISLGGVDPLVQPAADNKYIFLGQGTTENATSRFVKYAAKNGWKKIAFMSTSTAVGPLMQGQLASIIKGYPGMELVIWEKYEPTATDTKPQALKVKNANPEVVYLGGADAGSMVAVKDLLAVGVKVPIIHNHGMAQQSYLDTMGASVEGTYVISNAMLVAEQLPDSAPEKPMLLKFIKEYTTKFNRPTDIFVASGYDTINIIADALLRAGTTEPKALRDALEGVKGLLEILGVANYSATEHRAFNTEAFRVVKIENGKWKLIE